MKIDGKPIHENNLHVTFFVQIEIITRKRSSSEMIWVFDSGSGHKVQHSHDSFFFQKTKQDWKRHQFVSINQDI